MILQISLEMSNYVRFTIHLIITQRLNLDSYLMSYTYPDLGYLFFRAYCFVKLYFESSFVKQKASSGVYLCISFPRIFPFRELSSLSHWAISLQRSKVKPWIHLIDNLLDTHQERYFPRFIIWRRKALEGVKLWVRHGGTYKMS